MVCWSSDSCATPVLVRRILRARMAVLAEPGRLITGLKGTTLTREQAVELYRETFDKPEDAELCHPCAEAVVHAAR
jgi:hypothetical protein